jgi:hypothetical protein
MWENRSGSSLMVHCLPVRWVIPPLPALPNITGSERYGVHVQVPERAPAESESATHELRMMALSRALTSMSQLTAPLPHPLALAAIVERRGNPPQVYNRELRNPSWAQAMEGSINEFMETRVMSLFPGLVAEVECRSSTARVTFTVSGTLQRQLESKYSHSPSKVDTAIAIEVAAAVGPLAYAFREVVMPNKAVSLALAFDAEGMRPEGFRDRQKRLLAEFGRRR